MTKTAFAELIMVAHKWAEAHDETHEGGAYGARAEVDAIAARAREEVCEQVYSAFTEGCDEGFNFIDLTIAAIDAEWDCSDAKQYADKVMGELLHRRETPNPSAAERWRALSEEQRRGVREDMEKAWASWADVKCHADCIALAIEVLREAENEPT